MKNKPRVGFFDLETTALLQQQAVWKLKPCKSCGQISNESFGGIVVEGNEDNLHSIGMSVGAVRDASKAHTYTYDEEHAKGLIAHLHRLDLVVGYNIRKFDYIVLEQYGGTMLKHLPTFDMFLEVQHLTGERISLANIVKRTLNIDVPKLGAAAVDKWWNEEKQEVIDYCKSDVEITQKVFYHACKAGYLSYWDWSERGIVSIDTDDWADKCRLITQSEVPQVKCPVKEMQFSNYTEEFWTMNPGDFDPATNVLESS